MMEVIDIIKTLKTNIEKSGKKRLLFIDGEDPRAIEAARQIEAEDLAEVTLLVEKSTPNSTYREININTNPNLVKLLEAKYCEIRQGKEGIKEARAALKQRPFFAALLQKSGDFDGVIGGLGYATADILRAGFKVIGPKARVKTISSSMLMLKKNKSYVFSDISVIPNPTAEQLAEIAINAVTFAKQLGIDPKVAFLSFSTAGSAKTESSESVARAKKIFEERNQGVSAVGEIQFDAAFSEEIREQKYGAKIFSGEANVLIFPDLNSGNIGYKIAQRLADFTAVGPIITGISLPFNDLSRGAKVEDVYLTALLTAISCY